MEKKYTVSDKIITLVEKLIEEGYEGNISLTTSFPTSIADEFSGSVVLELSGFCKEYLYLAQCTLTGEIHAYGRYHIERYWHNDETIEVGEIVAIAWEMFETYEANGYSMPEEFKKLFLKYEYIEEKPVTTIKIVRKK